MAGRVLWEAMSGRSPHRRYKSSCWPCTGEFESTADRVEGVMPLVCLYIVCHSNRHSRSCVEPKPAQKGLHAPAWEHVTASSWGHEPYRDF